MAKRKGLEKVRLGKSHLLIISETERTYQFPFQIEGKTLTAWNEEKTLLCTFKISGEKLACLRKDNKNAKQVEGVGIKITSNNTSQFMLMSLFF